MLASGVGGGGGGGVVMWRRSKLAFVKQRHSHPVARAAWLVFCGFNSTRRRSTSVRRMSPSGEDCHGAQVRSRRAQRIHFAGPELFQGGSPTTRSNPWKACRSGCGGGGGGEGRAKRSGSAWFAVAQWCKGRESSALGKPAEFERVQRTPMWPTKRSEDVIG